MKEDVARLVCDCTSKLAFGVLAGELPYAAGELNATGLEKWGRLSCPGNSLSVKERDIFIGFLVFTAKPLWFARFSVLF